jgi:hypothetical protein
MTEEGAVTALYRSRALDGWLFAAVQQECCAVFALRQKKFRLM